MKENLSLLSLIAPFHVLFTTRRTTHTIPSAGLPSLDRHGPLPTPLCKALRYVVQHDLVSLLDVNLWINERVGDQLIAQGAIYEA